MSHPVTFTPLEIIDEWQPLIASISDQSIHLAAERYIQRTLPAKGFSQIDAAFNALLLTEPVPEHSIINQVRDDLKAQLANDNGNPFSKVEHPVNAALIKRFAPSEAELEATITRLFLDQCQRALSVPATAFKASVYYTDVLALRDTLIDLTVCRLHDGLVGHLSDSKQALLELCQQYANDPKHDEFLKLSPNQQNKLADVKSMVADQREPGRFRKDVKSRRASECTYIGIDPAADLVDDSWIARLEAGPRPEKSIADVLPDPDDDFVPKPCAADPVETEHNEMGLGLPGTATATQIRSRQRTLSHHIAGQSVPSISDIDQHSAADICTWLDLLNDEKTLLTAFCFLLAVSGMPLERLALTRVTSVLPERKTPHFCPETYRFRYVVENYRLTKGQSAQVVEIQLPEYWVDKLGAIPDELLFPQVVRDYNALLKAKPEAALPRLSDWSRSAHTLWRSTRDSLTAGVLAGAVPTRRLATSNYVQISLTSLNQSVIDAWKKLLTRAFELGLQAFATSWPAPTVAPRTISGLIGSNLYKPFGVDKGFFTALYKLRNKLQRQLKGPHSEQLTAWINLFNLMGLNHYLAASHFTICRPLNDSMEIHWSGNRLWVQDKLNSNFLERKYFSFEPNSPSLAAFNHQEAKCKQALIRLQTDLAPRFGRSAVVVENSGTYPRYAAMDSQSIEIKRLTAKVFDSLTEQFELPRKSLGPRNSNRHRLATLSRKHYPESVWLELIGHKHPGADRFGPESAASVTECHLPERFLEQWIEQSEWRVIGLPNG